MLNRSRRFWPSILPLVFAWPLACSNGSGGSDGGATGKGGGAAAGTTGAAAGTTGAAAGTTGAAAASVLQHHNDLARDGLYVDATLTKTAAAGMNIDASFAGAMVTGNVYAQP